MHEAEHALSQANSAEHGKDQPPDSMLGIDRDLRLAD